MTQILSSEPTLWFIRIIAFVFGALWGSFFNVAIYRWPRGMSVVTPPSHCPACRALIPAHLNLPIFGYFLLRGKAACCGAKLSPRYAMVEIIGAFLSLAVTERYIINAPLNAELADTLLVAFCYFAFVGGLVIATFVDLEFMEIPDEVSLPLTALGLVTATIRAEPGVEAAALGAGAGFLTIQLLFVWTYERITGRRGMGEGDSKLLMMIGAYLGWKGGLFCLFAGALQGMVVALVWILSGKPIQSSSSNQENEASVSIMDKGEEKEYQEQSDQEPDTDGDPPPKYVGHLKVPFGPFLCLGALEYLFFGDLLVSTYFELLGKW